MRRLKHKKYTKHANITSNSDLCTDERLITQTTVLIILDLRTLKGVRKEGLGLNPPPLELDILQKRYYHRKGDQLFSHTFLLLICRLNAKTTEQICMQISRNIINGLKK